MRNAQTVAADAHGRFPVVARAKRSKIRGSKNPANPRIVGRQTAARPSGKRYPVVLGEGATSLLMFLALNRGANVVQIKAALEIRSGSFHRRMRPLRERGVVVGRYWYQITTSLRNEKQLVLFLRALGEAHGMRGRRGTYGVRTRMARVDRVIVPPPPAMFGTRNRTRLLLAIAALNESYGKELHAVLGMHEPSARRSLEDLAVEGLLRSRAVGRAKCYSLDPTYPGAKHLLAYLRLECKAEPEMVAAANAALARRVEIQRAGRRSDVAKFGELETAALATTNAPTGVERGWRPRWRWKSLNGDWNGGRFVPSRQGRRFRLTDEEHARFRRLVLGDGPVRGRLLASARALEERLEKHERICTTDLYHWLYYRLRTSKTPMRRSDASRIAVVGLRAQDPDLPNPEDWRRAVLEQVPRVAAHRPREFLGEKCYAAPT